MFYLESKLRQKRKKKLQNQHQELQSHIQYLSRTTHTTYIYPDSYSPESRINHPPHPVITTSQEETITKN